MPPVGLPCPEAYPPSSAAGTRPGRRAPAVPPSWHHLEHSEQGIEPTSVKHENG